MSFRRNTVIALIVIGCAAVAVGLLPHDRDTARGLVAASLARQAVSKLPLPTTRIGTMTADQLPTVAVAVSCLWPMQREVKRAIETRNGFRAVNGQQSAGWGTLTVNCAEDDLGMRLTAIAKRDGTKRDGVESFTWTGAKRWPTPWSILPPVIAIALALAWRRAVIALMLGVLAAAALFVAGEGSGFWHLLTTLPLALWKSVTVHLFGALASPFSLSVLGFTFAICGMVGISNRAGGNKGLVQLFARLASTRRNTNIATILMGLAVFFDGYANAIVVGQTARPLTDAKRISREKLAYIVDSTASPIAGLAIISTWVGWEVGLFQSVADELGLALRGYEILIRALPFRFYCMFALILLIVSTVLRRDFGSMLKAEQRAFSGKGLFARHASLPESRATDALAPPDDAIGRWWLTLIPVLTMFSFMVIGLIGDGATHPAVAGIPFEWRWQHLQTYFVHGDSGRVLLYAAIVGSLCAFALATGVPFPINSARATSTRALSARTALRAWFSGGGAAVPALLLLLAARALQTACDDLSTTNYLVALVAQVGDPLFLPVITFVVAAFVAFGTGTSWGTMGILIPIVGPLAFHFGDATLLFLVLGSVLDGAIFGDHCSPISDTTIMSSLSCRCDHIDHVRTQAPYALTAMLVAALVGYLGVPAGLTSWQALAVGFAAIVVLFLACGKNPERLPISN